MKSKQLIDRSEDLRRLYDEGYEIEIRSEPAYVIVHHVPFVTAERKVEFGTLVCPYTNERPLPDHTMYFCGGTPHDAKGNKFPHIIEDTSVKLADDLTARHRISSKPVPEGRYPDFYRKFTRYVSLIVGPAEIVDKDRAIVRTYRRREVEGDSIFLYPDSATSRAGLGEITGRLRLDRIAIIGLGGTGSYILDLVAKTPVREIHLFDADHFFQHNAYRAPGAASLEDLDKLPKKVVYWAEKYEKMRTGITPHSYALGESNAGELGQMNFVFLSMDSGPAKKAVVERLLHSGVPFIDVGMGIHEVDGVLRGQLRTTLATPSKNDHLASTMSYADPDEADEYASNIQIADLNMLNAALAVIKWKKLFGVYQDLEKEHLSIYQISGNHLVNEEAA